MVQRVVICTTPLCFDCTCCFRDHMPAQEPLLISGECFRADCICFFQILLKLNHRICPVRHECYGQFLSKVKHLNQILLCNYVNIICDIFCHLKLRDYAWISVYYIDIYEVPGFFLLLKNHIFIVHSEDTFLSFMCEDIGIAMVTNINFDFLEQKI